MKNELPELERNRLVYKKLRFHMTLDEKIALLDFQGDYGRYQKTLLRLARKYKVPFPEV